MYSLDLDTLQLNDLFGIIVNTNHKFLLEILTSKHWFSLRRGIPQTPTEKDWYNLDSKLSDPYKFDSEYAFRSYLKKLLADDAQLLLVSKK